MDFRKFTFSQLTREEIRANAELTAIRTRLKAVRAEKKRRCAEIWAARGASKMLKLMRVNRGMTQAGLAAFLGVSQAAICMAESSKRPVMAAEFVQQLEEKMPQSPKGAANGSQTCAEPN